MGRRRHQPAREGRLAAPRPWAVRHFWALLGLVVAGAAAIRLAAGFQLLEVYPAVRYPADGTDMATYYEFATQLMNGQYDWSRGFYYQPFYYAAFLPAVFWVFTPGPVGVIVVQALLGAGAVGLIGLSFAGMLGRRVGLIGALLLALSRMHIFYTPFMLNEVLQSFNLALLLWLAVVAWRRGGWWWWGLAGLACGVGNATRGNLILILPLLVLLAGWRFRARRPRAALLAILLAGSFYLPQLPFAAVNYRAHGKWIGASSAAGAVLALGNTPEAPPGGRNPDSGAGPMEYPASCLEWTRLDRLPEPDRIPVSTSIRRWFMAEPLAYAELKWRMLLLFWNRAEIPNNVAIEVFGKPLPSFVATAPYLLDFLVLGVLGLCGMVYSLMDRRRHALTWFALATVGTYCASIVLFYILARFRLPVVPLLCGFGGYAVIHLTRVFRRYRRSGNSVPVTLAAGLLFMALVFVGWGFDIYRFSFEKPTIRLVRPHGVQVRLERQWLVKDNGPFSFGGWMPLPAGNIAVTKTFRLPAETRSGAVPTVRLAVTAGAPMGCQFTVEGGESRHVDLKVGLQWVELRGAPLDAAASCKVTFKAVPDSPSELTRFHVLLDTQRHYGRTRLDDPRLASIEGELVVELLIPVEETSP